MKKLGKFKLFGLVAILTGSLIFLGISFLEAKKKDPGGIIKWPGKVKILDTLGSNNLYGVGDISESTYTNNVFIETKGGGKSTAYRFKLTIKPEETESRIGFRDIIFYGSGVIAEEKPCYFPDVTVEYCEDPNYDYDAPLCMKDFLEFSDDIPGDFYHPHPDYLYLYLSIKVVYEIEDVGYYDNVPVPGHVNLEITRYNHIQEPCDYHHSIVGHLDVPDPDGRIQIKKKYVADNDNTWIINVNGTFRFSELYWGWIERGKGGKPKGAHENKIPLQVQIPINFETEWTKIIVE